MLFRSFLIVLLYFLEVPPFLWILKASYFIYFFFVVVCSIMYEFTIFMLDRGIALVNFIVIYSFYIQMPGLVFHDGITPGMFNN